MNRNFPRFLSLMVFVVSSGLIVILLLSNKDTDLSSFPIHIIALLALIALIAGFVLRLMSSPNFLERFKEFIGYPEDDEENLEDHYVLQLKQDFGIAPDTDDDEKDILKLMIRNMAEIREYFKISKQHAKQSYNLALWTAVSGFALFVFAVIMYFFTEKVELSIFSLIGGFVTEFVSVVAMQIHKDSQKQLNHYYQALHDNEKFLSAVHLVGLVSEDKRDDIYTEIIRNSISNVWSTKEAAEK